MLPQQEDSASTNDSESQQPQTLYVAIQPGAESGQGDQPAVYLEVVEAGSGTEVTSSDGQVNLVQEEMVIDNGKQACILVSVCHTFVVVELWWIFRVLSFYMENLIIQSNHP